MVNLLMNPDPMQRSTGGIPRLYQKYVGHDNNRDFYASTQPETENMNRIMFREWFPQIVYNHHQSGPAGTVMFAPPFRDPPNHYLDPLIITSSSTWRLEPRTLRRSPLGKEPFLNAVSAQHPMG